MRRLSSSMWLRTAFLAACVLAMASQAVAQTAAEPATAGLMQSALRELESAQTTQPARAGARRDPVWNGVLIGAGIGTLVGLIPDYYDDCEECHDALWGSMAVGAGIGLAVDLLRNGKQGVSPPPSGRPQLQVALDRHRVGVRGTVRWR